MSSEILINTTGRETRVALLEKGQLVELHIDRGRNRGFVGNVYLGKVVRVLPGIQAAFVDIGLEKAAFLYAGDIHAPSLSELSRLRDGSPLQQEASRATPQRGHAPIQDMLKEGQTLVVQVAKDPISDKGARVTTHITLPGRYIVYMPTVEHIGISRRIDREKERRRLRELIDRKRPAGAGFIVRTVCAYQSDEILVQDMEYLLKTWTKIQKDREGKKAPALLHADYNLSLRFLRDNYTSDVERVVVDSRAEYDRIRNFMNDFMPQHKNKVHYYKGKAPAFDVYGVEAKIHQSLGRKVWLKSGGYLVIDQTEALTAIDVNSGKFVGKSSLEETTTQLNLEAVEEVVYQLRLRNIGGIIIIDFIDMDAESNRERVYQALIDAVSRDRARTNVLKISDMGLVEMTRKRVQEDINRFVSEECFYCKGSGVLKSRETLCFDILRALRREHGRSPEAKTLYANVHPQIADQFYGEDLDSMEQFEREHQCRVVIRAMGHYHLEQYEVYSR